MSFSITLRLVVVVSHKLYISRLDSAVMYTKIMCLDCLKIYIFNTRKSIPLLHLAMIYTCTTTLFVDCIQCYIFNTKLQTQIIPFISLYTYHEVFLKDLVISSTAIAFVLKVSKGPFYYSRFRICTQP